MASAKTEFLTPVGRLVQGDPFKPQTTDMQGQPLVFKTGPNAGKPRPLYMLTLAIPKTDPAFAQFYGSLLEAARTAWPQFFQGPAGADGRPTLSNPNLSLKVQDGDGFDGQGKPNSGKEGFAGHWIVKSSSSYPPRCFHQGHYAPHEEIKDPMTLRRGYYVRVSGTLESNQNAQKPGMYVNCGLVELVGHGPEIVSGPDALSVFGGAPVAALPQGATALPTFTGGTPFAPAAMPGGMPQQQPAALPGMPGMMAAPAAPAGLPGMPGMAPVQQAAPPTFVAPNPGMLAGPGGVAPAGPAFGAPAGLPGMPAMAMAPAGPQLTPLGQSSGMTYAQMIAAGYNDAQLRQGGYII